MPNSLGLSQTISQLFRLADGLNLVDPHITLAPGVATVLKNMECLVNGGYRCADGYERFDGREKPSAATYTVLTFTLGGNREVIVGDTITGVTSGATGLVVAAPALTSGDWAVVTAAGSVAIYLLSGSFTNGESLTVGGVYAAVLTTSGAFAVDDAYYKEAIRGARNYRRNLIQKVPGEGSVLGVVNFGNTVYAFRNAVGGATAKLYKSTGSGWSEIAMLHFTAFTAGSGPEPVAGETLTRGANTATIKKVLTTSGTWGGGTAAGVIWHTAPTPGNFAAGAGTASGGATLTVSGANTAYTLQPSGSYEFVIHNFAGATGTRCIYGCDGKNKAFEFNPTLEVLVPITTGMTVDTPSHIAVHNNFLFLSFKHSLQLSGAGSPFTWVVTLGAAELAMGDDITALMPMRGQVLAVFCKAQTALLYGTGSSNWDLKKFAIGMGSAAATVRELQGDVLYFDARGLFFLAATADYGDFKPNAQTKNIAPLIDAKRRLPVTALVCKNKSQYRAYMNDKVVLTGTFYGGKLIGWATATTSEQFICTWSGDDANGAEVMYAGTDDGYVMQLDIGTSYDGDAIEHVIRTPFSYFKSPLVKKRWRKLTLEMQTQFPIQLTVAIEYDYGSQQQSVDYAAFVSQSGGYWDDAIWNQFYWDGAVISAPFLNIDGVSKNIGFLFRHADDVDEPWSIEAVNIQYSPWGMSR